MSKNLLYEFDREIARSQNGVIYGTDEAGRGPLAGPVVAATVMLDLNTEIEGINDSKKLSEKKRDALYDVIIEKACFYAVSVSSPEEIDRINILQASLLSMYRSFCEIDTGEGLLLVDGNKKIPHLDTFRQFAVVKGDSKSASIAAASILAKVTRDRIMMEYHRHYPEYRFDLHKGYPTEFHRTFIKQNGITPIHRKTFCEGILSVQTLDLF